MECESDVLGNATQRKPHWAHCRRRRCLQSLCRSHHLHHLHTLSTLPQDVNGGIEYTERVQGAKALSLLQWYASRHAANASVDSWRASIEGGQVRINGQAVTDPEAPIP